MRLVITLYYKDEPEFIFTISLSLLKTLCNLCMTGYFLKRLTCANGMTGLEDITFRDHCSVFVQYCQFVPSPKQLMNIVSILICEKWYHCFSVKFFDINEMNVFVSWIFTFLDFLNFSLLVWKKFYTLKTLLVSQEKGVKFHILFNPIYLKHVILTGNQYKFPYFCFCLKSATYSHHFAVEAGYTPNAQDPHGLDSHTVPDNAEGYIISRWNQIHR